MKALFLFFILFFITPITWAQTNASKVKIKYLPDLLDDKDCFTFKDKNPYKVSGNRSDIMIVKICKGDDASQLSALSLTQIWLGKNYPNVDYSEIVITFSQPIYSINFLMSHFNNDSTSGDEQVEAFRIFDENKNELKNFDLNWSAGSSWTSFDPVNQIIKGLPGAWGSAASGKLSISNTTPFTKITFRQTVLRGNPNGIIINDEINYSRTLDSTAQKVNTDTLTIKKTEPITSNIIADTNQINKEVISLLTNTKTDTIVLNKITPVEDVLLSTKEVEPATPAPVENKEPVPVKKIIPKPSLKTTATPKKTVINKPTKTPVKKTTAQPTVKKTVQAKATPTKVPIPKKTIVKKPIQAKTPIKKTPTVKPSPTKAIDSVLTYKLSEIKELKVGEKIKLEKVFFKQSLPEFSPESFPELDTLVLVLKQYTNLEIEIQGHTDNQGMAVLNQQLSEQRAEAVKQYLIDKGILATRLSAKGYGSSRPFTDNESEEHRRKNRRVEFMITKR